MKSTWQGNNRPIDALQQGRIVLTNPGIPSYEDLKDFLYIGDFYEMYQEMIKIQVSSCKIMRRKSL